MLSPSHRCVVVGAGHAGGRAVQAMRMAGFAGKITLIGEEQHVPYVRPPLSKAVLTGTEVPERAYLNPPQFYAELGVELLLGTSVKAIDSRSQVVDCSNGQRVLFDSLLLTTGARVRNLDVPGAKLPGVHYLRTYEDAVAIRTAISRSARIAIIGGGFIGLEVAASARTCGCPVSVIETAGNLMSRAVAPEIGAWFQKLHVDRGVDVYLGSTVSLIEGKDRVESVLLANGTRLLADIVVIGIGITPNTELAEAAQIQVHNGIVVDEFGRTSTKNIFAAGDVCNQPNDFLRARIRLESYQNAQDQSTRVGSNMCLPVENMKPYSDRLWFWTDQFKVNLQILGQPPRWDRLVFRGDIKSNSFMVFYMERDQIVSVNTINSGREMQICERLMLLRRTIPADKLADTRTKLRSLL